MYRKLIIAAAFVCSASPIFAQKASLRYQGSVAAGFTAGESAASFVTQLVNGVSYKTWSAGIGIGLDDYHTRSVPVFLDVRKTVSARPQTAFFYLDAGYNHPIWTGSDKLFVLSQKGGFYGEGGIGYYVPVLKTKQFFFSAGYRLKTFTKVMNSMPYLSIWPPPENAWRNYDYTVTSISVKTGLRF